MTRQRSGLLTCCAWQAEWPQATHCEPQVHSYASHNQGLTCGPCQLLHRQGPIHRTMLHTPGCLGDQHACNPQTPAPLTTVTSALFCHMVLTVTFQELALHFTGEATWAVHVLVHMSVCGVCTRWIGLFSRQ